MRIQELESALATHIRARELLFSKVRETLSQFIKQSLRKIDTLKDSNGIYIGNLGSKSRLRDGIGIQLSIMKKENVVFGTWKEG